MRIAKIARLDKGIEINEICLKTKICGRKKYSRFENGGDCFSEEQLKIASTFLGVEPKVMLQEVRVGRTKAIIDDDTAQAPRRHTQTEKARAASAT